MRMRRHTSVGRTDDRRIECVRAAMGAGDSKQESSSNYDLSKAGGEAPQELPRDLHQGPIHSLAVADRHHLLTGGADKEVVLYSWANHRLRARFKGPTKDISQVAYLPNSQLVIAGSRDRNIYTWKISEAVPNGTPPTTREVPYRTVEEPDKTIEGHTLGVTALAVSNDHADVLCSGSRDNSVCLWDLNTGRPISSMHIPRNLVTELKWIEGERAVVQSSEDKTLRVWDLRSCCVAQQLKPKQHVQMCCGVTKDGHYLLAGSSGTQGQGAELTVWDRRKERKPLREYKGHSESILSCMFCCNRDNDTEEHLIASVGNDSVIKIWDRESGDCLHTEIDSGAGPLTSLVAPDKGLVGYSSFQNGVSIWTLNSHEDSGYSLTLRARY